MDVLIHWEKLPCRPLVTIALRENTVLVFTIGILA